MTKNEFVDCLKVFENAGLRYTPVINKDFYRTWFAFFEKDNPALLQAAVIKYIANNKEFPTIADIKETMREIVESKKTEKAYQLMQSTETKMDPNEAEKCKNILDNLIADLKNKKQLRH